MSASEKSYWTNLATFYSPMCRRFDEPANEEYESAGVADCDYCQKLVPSRIMIPNEQYRPICLCCVVRCAYMAPVGEDVHIRPDYAWQLLDESDFGRRRVVPMEDVDEIDLEDPDTGRIFGSLSIHHQTGREIVWDDDGHPRLCLTCPSGGGRCWLCETQLRRELGIPPSRISSKADLAFP